MSPSLRCASSITSATSYAKQVCKAAQSSRQFSTTHRHEQRTTRARRAMWRWIQTQGENFRNPLAGSTNYLNAYNKEGQLKRVIDAEMRVGGQKKDGLKPAEGSGGKKELPAETPRDMRPFPLNENFLSQPVLSEAFRWEIWYRIMRQGKSVREVSAEMKVEMSRVGAVVRLMEVEMEWKKIGKPLARPYAAAIMAMLPKTEYIHPTLDEKGNVKPLKTPQPKPHESINDLPVHALTGPQIFQPTSESRHFTRVDAAKVFSEKLLPADDRIPHPELVFQHREQQAGLSELERVNLAEARARQAEIKAQKAAAKQAKKDREIKRIDKGRWEFRFTEVSVDDVGKTGRGSTGVGWRYGMPHNDRDRGLIKIPKTVEG